MLGKIHDFYSDMSSVSMTQDSPKKSCSFAQKKTDIRIDKIPGVTVDEGNVASALVRPISTDVSCINGRGTRPERIERETDLSRLPRDGLNVSKHRCS